MLLMRRRRWLFCCRYETTHAVSGRIL